MMYTQQEIILLNILMKRVLRIPYNDTLSSMVFKPDYVGVDKWNGNMRLCIGFNDTPLLTSTHHDIVMHLAKAYGLNTLNGVLFFRGGKWIAEDHDYAIYNDLSTYGELKPIS